MVSHGLYWRFRKTSQSVQRTVLLFLNATWSSQWRSACWTSALTQLRIAELRSICSTKLSTASGKFSQTETSAFFFFCTAAMMIGPDRPSYNLWHSSTLFDSACTILYKSFVLQQIRIQTGKLRRILHHDSGEGWRNHFSSPAEVWIQELFMSVPISRLLQAFFLTM